ARPQGQKRRAERPSDEGDEICALRRLQREQRPSSYVFVTERDGPMTPKAFSCAVRPDRGSGQDAVPDLSAHVPPRLRLCPGQCQLRHSCIASTWFAPRSWRRIVQGLLAIDYYGCPAGTFRRTVDFPRCERREGTIAMPRAIM